MFSFHRQAAQAKKRTANQAANLEFEWKAQYNWLLLLVILVGAVFYLSQQKDLMPIKKIKLSGSFEHINQHEVESILQPIVGEGFFSLDIHQLRKMLSEKSWTKSVSIRRVWPDRLDITIVERKPVARWDDRHLISDRAVVFAADSRNFQQLPLIHTEIKNHSQILTSFYRLSRRFKLVGETVLSLRQDSRGALDIELPGSLIVKLGRGQIEHKIDRLITIYMQQIRPRRADIQQLDLRYSNGFAVAWKKETLEASDEASIWSNSNV